MNVKIPKYWTPEQANAVAEFLGEMEIAIRKKHQARILAQQLSELYREERTTDKKKKQEDDVF